MKAFGEDVIHLKEVFPQDPVDTEWLQYVGQHQMFVITRDERVRWRPAELQALRSYNTGAFFLGGKNLTRCKLIQQLVRNWPRIKEFASTTRKPFIFRVPPTGTKFVRIPLT